MLAGDLIAVVRHSIGADLGDASIDEIGATADQYRGESLEGFGLREPEFDYWLTAERAPVRSQMTSLLSALRTLERCLVSGDTCDLADMAAVQSNAASIWNAASGRATSPRSTAPLCRWNGTNFDKANCATGPEFGFATLLFR